MYRNFRCCRAFEDLVPGSDAWFLLHLQTIEISHYCQLVTINLVLLDISCKAFTPKIRTFEFVVQVDFAYMLDVDSLGINVKVRLLLPSPMLFMLGLF